MPTLSTIRVDHTQPSICLVTFPSCPNDHFFNIAQLCFSLLINFFHPSTFPRLFLPRNQNVPVGGWSTTQIYKTSPASIYSCTSSSSRGPDPGARRDTSLARPTSSSRHHHRSQCTSNPRSQRHEYCYRTCCNPRYLSIALTSFRKLHCHCHCSNS